MKIEKESDGRSTFIRLSGRIRSTDIGIIRAQMEGGLCIVLVLSEVTLVDIEVVRFLSNCENAGAELLDSPPFIRAWIDRERHEGEPDNTV